jgi:hypothetical protein
LVATESWVELNWNYVPFSSVRDVYEPKREEVAKKVSEALKVDFKITIDPNATFAYAADGWAKNSHGDMLASCVPPNIQVSLSTI